MPRLPARIIVRNVQRRTRMRSEQIALRNPQKALAADAVVVVRVAPCKPIAKNSMHRSMCRTPAETKGMLLPFCIAKTGPVTDVTATSALISHRSIWS